MPPLLQRRLKRPFRALEATVYTQGFANRLRRVRCTPSYDKTAALRFEGNALRPHKFKRNAVTRRRYAAMIAVHPCVARRGGYDSWPFAAPVCLAGLLAKTRLACLKTMRPGQQRVSRQAGRSPRRMS